MPDVNITGIEFYPCFDSHKSLLEMEKTLIIEDRISKGFLQILFAALLTCLLRANQFKNCILLKN